ncbi:hypothetical protein LH51_09385 [Nitrincola sp. A-D6]|uniref:ESPR-type extended signal peptide-containing protein n=1 Tax=Nitrincola sp. A-D6 TaxID=1545442 RepID=UPI00051F9F02|nr:ESPR-type extended signal peptide-containing protein [Nitrincola sp. A-D6]KGK42130.1 hypothetical protein LH51_09385 [Nitrincola sp. A-D6]
MNHVYKTVWNAGLQAWVAVSEMVKGKGKSKSAAARCLAPVKKGVGLLIVSSLGLSMAPSVANAVANDVIWSNSSTGEWTDTNNWDGSNLPTDTDTAVIANGGALVSAGTTTGGNFDTFVGTLAFNTSTFYKGFLTVDGNLSTGQLVVGGRLETGGAQNSAIGRLTIQNGGVVNSTSALLGGSANSNGTATVTGSTSRWNIVDALIVGHSDIGTLSIIDGGVVSSAEGTIGSQSNAHGTVIIGGAGSQWIIDGGAGTLQLSSLGGANLIIGEMNTGNPSVTAPGTLSAAGIDFGSFGGLQFNHNSDNYSFAPDITSGAGVIHLLSGTTRFNNNLTNPNNSFAGPGGGSLNVQQTGTLELEAGKSLYVSGYSMSSGTTLQVNVTNDTTYGKLVANTMYLPSDAKFHVNVANPNFGFTTAVNNGLTDILSANDQLLIGGVEVPDGPISDLQVTDNSVLFDFSAARNANSIDLILSAVGGGGGGGGGGDTGSDSGLVEQIVVAQGNSPATGAARALDTIINAEPGGAIGSLFVPFTTNEQVNDAVTQTLPLLTGGSQVAATSALTGMNRVVQARIESNQA